MLNGIIEIPSSNGCFLDPPGFSQLLLAPSLLLFWASWFLLAPPGFSSWPRFPSNLQYFLHFPLYFLWKSFVLLHFSFISHLSTLSQGTPTLLGVLWCSSRGPMLPVKGPYDARPEALCFPLRGPRGGHPPASPYTSIWSYHMTDSAFICVFTYGTDLILVISYDRATVHMRFHTFSYDTRYS